MVGCKRPIEDLKKWVDIHKLTPNTYRYIVRRVAKEKNLTLVKSPASHVKFLLPSKMYHFLQVAQSLSPKHRLLSDILFQTGLRISELQILDIKDIDLESNTLHVLRGKGGYERRIPISNSLIQQINLFVAGRKKGSIFLKDNGVAVSVRSLQRWFQQVGEKAGLGVLNPHIARHTFATYMVGKGMPKEAVQQMLGHSTMKTTEIYAKAVYSPEIKDKYLLIMEEKLNII